MGNRLKVQVKGAKRNSYDAWTYEEDVKLLQEYQAGLKIREMAELHQRSEGAMRARLHKNGVSEDVPDEAQELLSFKRFKDSLLKCDHFIAKSEYLDALKEYDDAIQYFDVLMKSGTLEYYCKDNKLIFSDFKATIEAYRTFEKLVDSHNEEFITSHLKSDKEYLDNILKESDPNIILDDDQRRVILTDEDYSLVVAGAGAGKTTTVAAKVKYLVEKQNIDPKDILVVSFTNKAVKELKQRIIGELHIECPIATFHSTGNAIIRKQNPEKLNIVGQWDLYNVVQEYFTSTILKNEGMVNNLILFFASYFDAPHNENELKDFFNNIAKANYSTMKSEIDDYKKEIIDRKTHQKVTIQSEVMRSVEEVIIANYLYINGIDYDYEPIYRYHIPNARKPYTPDFLIRQGDKEAYIEHFGITEDGRNDRYNEYQLDAYKRAVRDKWRLHQKHKTTLIYTFSSFNDGRSITDHLEEKLIGKGFKLNRRSNEEIMEKLVKSEENRYIKNLVNLICRFISNFKVNGYEVDEFVKMRDRTNNVRSKLFLEICQACYLEYQKYLRENGAVDFEDMINESARILREIADMKRKLSFKYVIVDEYQDISRQRFDLVSALHEVTDAKIMAVGDDWQSIYAFSGSDITLFTKFEEKMGYAALLKIVKTYRNSQEVIDIAGNFIQKNPEQIAKRLISNKNISDPVIIYTYDDSKKKADADNKSGAQYNQAYAVEVALRHILDSWKVEKKKGNPEILLLGRYNFDGYKLENSGKFEFISRGGKIKSVKYPFLNITFMTAHASKGLGYDNVIVINGKNETYGFPSKIEDDPVLKLVIREDRAIEYAEERRLFYVAMTRTKNRVYFVAPEKNPSEFLLEIKKDYKNVVLKGTWNSSEEVVVAYRKTCPICGYPLQYRYKPAYGLKLYICTNEPEMCDFMTNQYGAGVLSIQKCDKCTDGYLIAKRDKNSGYFLGCTNYKSDKTGCNNTISRKDYLASIGRTDDKPVDSVIIPSGINITPANISETKKQQSTEHIEKQKEPERAEVKSYFYKNMDLNDVIYIAIACLSHMSEKRFYGVNMLADILRGSQNKRILKAKLNEISEYGKLKLFSKNEVIILIAWLLDNKYAHKTKGSYPVLHPTYEGTNYNETLTAAKVRKLKKMLEEADSESSTQKINEVVF